MALDEAEGGVVTKLGAVASFDEAVAVTSLVDEEGSRFGITPFIALVIMAVGTVTS